MSTGADAIVISITSLVDALKALLETETLGALIRLIKRLKQQSVLKALGDGIGFLSEKVQLIVDWLQSFRGIQVQVEAMRAFLGLVDSLTEGLHQVLEHTGKELASSGLTEMQAVFTPITGAVGIARTVTVTGNALLGLLPSEDAVQKLSDKFVALRGRLKVHNDSLQAPAQPAEPLKQLSK